MKYARIMKIISILLHLFSSIQLEADMVLDDATTWIGRGTLLAAILTAMHKGLYCDAHQAECRRLVQVYRGLEVRYRTLAQIEKPVLLMNYLP
jgi:hypothetical protein